MNYTILRPSGLASNILSLAEQFRNTGIYLLIGNSKNRSSIVSTDDLAKIAIKSVILEEAKKQTFAVGGPDILQREDIPRIFARIFSQEPIIINIPLMLVDGLRSGLGLINPKLQKSLGTFRTLLANEFYCTQEEVNHLQSIYGIEMESLENFLRRYLGA